jgi:hypothetical protein
LAARDRRRLTLAPIKEIGDILGPQFIGVASRAYGLTVSFVSCGALGLRARRHHPHAEPGLA